MILSKPTAPIFEDNCKTYCGATQQPAPAFNPARPLRYSRLSKSPPYNLLLGIIQLRQFLAICLCIFSLTTDRVYANDHVNQARQNLKTYGLSSCFDRQFLDASDAKKDIEMSIDAYSHSNRGMHLITNYTSKFRKFSDAYAATKYYYFYAYDHTRVISPLSNKQIALLSCLAIYNSEELDSFITTQDKYIFPES